MRYALLSDVHSNLHALQAVLDDVSGQDVDDCLCAGDLVGYGALPNECVDLLAARGVQCVAGNHDLMALGLLGEDRCTPSARDAMRWTRGVLRDDVLAFLAALPLRRDLPGTLVTHGSLDDPQEYVRGAAAARAQLDGLERSVRFLVLGHTHEAWVHTDRRGTLVRTATARLTVQPDERALVNPGSVGQSRTGSPAARYAVLDDATGEVALRAVAYDVVASRRALLTAGLPADSYHCRPPPLRRLAARVRLVVHAVPAR